ISHTTQIHTDLIFQFIRENPCSSVAKKLQLIPQLLVAGVAHHLQTADLNVPVFFSGRFLVFVTADLLFLGFWLTALRAGNRDGVADMLSEIKAVAGQLPNFALA